MKFNILMSILFAITATTSTYAVVSTESIKNKQEALSDQIEVLVQEPVEVTNEVIDKVKVETKPVPEKNIKVEPVTYKYDLDTETQSICDEILSREGYSENSVIGNIVLMCKEIFEEEFESKEDFNSAVIKIKEKWKVLQISEQVDSRS